MSLNWREIDLVLSELDLVGSRIQRVAQPSFDTLVLGLYGRKGSLDLLLSVAHGACRLHSLYNPLPKNERPLRFMECLRSRLRGGRMDSALQLGTDRILRFDIETRRQDGEAGGAEEAGGRTWRLYAKLWSGAGNIILCDDEDLIVDALARRPGRGEEGGMVLAWAKGAEPGRGVSDGQTAKPARVFVVRDLPAPEGRPGADFNARVEAWYAARGGELSRENLLALARERFAKRKSLLETRIASLEERAGRFRDASRQRELGDIIMANLGSSPAGRYLVAEDFYRGGEVSIPLEPGTSLVDSARAYYLRAKKEAGALAEVELEVGRWKTELAALAAELERLEGLGEAILIAKAMEKGGTTRSAKEKPHPGIGLERSGWTLMIGRSAKENDELLRSHVRGSDLWLHARDYAGSYVFVKSKRDKTVPLEVLLDAATLALYYSKGRAAGEGDLYYTWVKYLRRVKGGPKGLVIPTQEKNLHVRIEEGRLRELRAAMGAEGPD